MWNYRVGYFWGGDGERILRINLLSLSANPSTPKRSAQSRVCCSWNAPRDLVP